MPRIDGILNIVVQQDATELKLGTDKVPKLLRRGTPQRFMMPETSAATLKNLLGELFDQEKEDELYEKSSLRSSYDHPTLGYFDLLFKLRFAPLEDGDEDDEDVVREVTGFDVSFMREAKFEGDPRDYEPDFLNPSAQETPSPEHPPPQQPPLQNVPNAQTIIAVPTSHAQPALRTAHPEPSASLTSVLARVTHLRASDLHLAQGEPTMMRQDGTLRPFDGSHDPIEDLLEGCMIPSVRRDLEQGSSADIVLDIPSIGRFRLNIYHAHPGLCAAIRVLPRFAPDLTTLNLPSTLHNLTETTQGLILVTGPTGSGKTSTIAALLQHALRQQPRLLITLEDPIEYVFQGRTNGSIVRQREVGRHVSSFSVGLRDALREDPDLLLVGEMRDVETINLALTAAETGHLVFASLHSRSAPSAIERIVDSYPAERQNQIRVQLADSLHAVVSQRLVPRKQSRGRLPAIEVMRVTHSVSNLIREGRTAQIVNAIQAGAHEGMIPLERSLADLVRSSRITPDVARAYANDLTSLQSYIKR